MAYIGCLGDIPFEVSSRTVQTLSAIKVSGSAKYATHQRRGGSGLSEFIGYQPEKISFDMTLSAYLGVNPSKLIDKIARYMRSGRTMPLVIGDRAYGEYRWTIVRYDARVENTDNLGNITTAKVSVHLQEYLRS